MFFPNQPLLLLGPNPSSSLNFLHHINSAIRLRRKKEMKTYLYNLLPLPPDHPNLLSIPPPASFLDLPFHLLPCSRPPLFNLRHHHPIPPLHDLSMLFPLPHQQALEMKCMSNEVVPMPILPRRLRDLFWEIQTAVLRSEQASSDRVFDLVPHKGFRARVGERGG